MDTENLNNKIDHNQLVPTDEIIKLAKESGVKFGFGDTRNRIRYLIKNGLLPHQARKVIDNKIVPHLPYSALARLIEIQNLQNTFKYTIPQLIQHFNDADVKSERAKYEKSGVPGEDTVIAGPSEAENASVEGVPAESEGKQGDVLVAVSPTKANSAANPPAVEAPAGASGQSLVTPGEEKVVISDTVESDLTDTDKVNGMNHSAGRYVTVSVGALLLLLGVIAPSLVQGKGFEIGWLTGPVSDSIASLQNMMFGEDSASDDSQQLSQFSIEDSQSEDSASSTVLPANVAIFGINIPSYFSDTATFEAPVTFEGGVNIDNQNLDLGDGSVFASNLIYGITGGVGMQVSAGQNPVLTNTGVLSFGGETGDVELQPGEGIEVDGTQITNIGVLSLGGETGAIELTAGSDIDIDGLEIALQPTLDTVEQINLPANSSTALRFGGIGLGSAGSSVSTSGASLVGFFDNINNSASSNLQLVITDIDTAIGDRVYTGANYVTSGDSITQSIMDLDETLALVGGGSIVWLDGGDHVYTANGEFLGNPDSGGANKTTGIYLGDSDPIVFGSDNDFMAAFDGTQFALSDGSNIFVSIIDTGSAANFAINRDDLYVASSGRVGIGTTAPTTALNVIGSGTFTGQLSLGTIPSVGSASSVLTSDAGVVSSVSVAGWDTNASNDVTTFTGLTDTPANYVGAADYFVKVNALGNALEFTDLSSWDQDTSNDVTTSGGTARFIPLWDTTSALITSILYQESGSDYVGIGTTAPSQQLDVAGGINITDDLYFSGVGIGTTGGASFVGVNTSGFSNSTASILQTVLADLDSAIGVANHDPVTLAGSYDYLTLTDQEITLNQIDLATDVSGLLSVANGGLGANVTAAGAGEILFSTATTTYDSLAAGSQDQILLSNAAASPSWTNLGSLVSGGDDISVTGSTSLTVDLDDDITLISVSAADNTGISFYDNGSNLGIYIEDGGDVGIGRTSPQYKLDVQGTGRFSGNLVLSAVPTDGSDNILVYGAGGIISQRDASGWDTDASNDVTTFIGLTDTPLDYTASNNYLVRVNAAGNALEFVDPASVGGVTSVANADGTLVISPTTGDVVASLNLNNANSWLAAQTFTANTYFPGSGVWNTSGQVGIGTTAPNYRLDVAGTAAVSNLVLGGTQITSSATELNILDGATLSTAELNILDGATVTFGELNLLDGSTATAGGIVFGNGTYLTQDAASFFFDDSTNRLGIGTTAPVYSIDVSGGIRVTDDLYVGNIGLGQTASSTGSGAFLVGTFDAFTYSNGTNVQAVLEDLDAQLVTSTHDAVTLAGAYDYLTLSGQQITLNQVDLTTDVTGTLPTENGGTGLNVDSTAIADGQIYIGSNAADGFVLATITAGTGIGIGNGAGSITITNSDLGSSQNIFKNFAVSGQGTVSTDTNNDTLTLVAGTNVTITTDTGTDSITINASDTDTNTTYTAGSGLTLVGTTFELGGEIDQNTRLFSTTGGELMFFDNTTGYLGIGTTSPTFKLDVNGTARFAGNVRLDSVPSEALDSILVLGTNGVVSQRSVSAWDLDASDDLTGTGTDNYIPLWTSASDLTSSLLYQATGTNYIGIGTTAPAQQLDVNGNIRTSGDFFVGNIGLGSTNPSAAGAYLVGVYDEFSNSDGLTVQDVLDDLDASISGSSHSAVTLAGSYDYLTLSGQEITLNQIDLTTDVSGILPVENGGTGLNITDTDIADGDLLIGSNSGDGFVRTTLTSSTGISITNGAGSITIANTDLGSSQNIFKNFAVSGQGTVSTDTNNDTLTLIAGTNVTITTDTGTDSITINASDTDTDTTYTDGNGLTLVGTEFNLGGEVDEDTRLYSATSGELFFINNTTGYIGLGNTAPTEKLDVTGNVRTSGDFYVGNIGLGSTGTASSGASLVGLFDNSFDNIAANTTVQGAFGELDTAIGLRNYTEQNYVTNSDPLADSIDDLDLALYDVATGATGLWRDTTPGVAGGITYLDDQTANVGIGGTAASAPFFFNVASGFNINLDSATAFQLGDGTNTLATFDTTLGASSDLFSLNVPSGSSIENLFAIYDNGSPVFRVSQNQIESAVPHTFTAAGDVSMSYDLNFTNATSAYINFEGPGYIRTNHPSGHYNLTLSAANDGVVLIDDDLNITGDQITLTNAAALDLADSTTALNIELGLLNIDTTNSRIGIGTTVPGSKLAVSGNQVIGAGYAALAAPTNGLLVQGNVGIGLTATNYQLAVGGTASVSNLVLAGTQLTATGAEINLLSGLTADSSELNILDGATVNTTELNYLDGTTAVAGGIIFGNGTYLTQDAANFFFDDATNRLGIGTTAPGYALDVVGGIRTSDDFYVGNIGLGTTNPSAAGAYLVGVYDEFANSDGLTVQDVLDDLDASISGSSHDPVTLAGIYDYLTLSGQEITLQQLDLTTDVSGVLPVENGGTGQNITDTSIADGQILIGNNSTDSFDLTTITSGTGISVTNGAGSITIANTDLGSSQNIFKNFAVSGQNTVIADGNDDTLSLVAGTNVTITTDDSTDSITITAADTDTTYTDGNGLTLVGTEFNLGGEIDENTRLFSLTSGELFFINNTTGNIGLGNTAPNYKLDVSGTAAVSDLVLGGTQITSSAAELNILDGATLSTTELNYLDGTTVPAGSVMFANGTFLTNDVSNFFFNDSTNRLGIGTSAPGSTLSVSGNQTIGSGYATLAAPTNGLLVQGNVGIGVTATNFRLAVGGTASLSDLVLGGTQVTSSATELNVLDGITSTTAQLNYLTGSSVVDGGLVFGNGSNFTQDVASIFWNNSLNRLGIGTSSPSYTLDVVGTGRFTGQLTLDTVPLVANNDQVLTVNSGIVSYIDTSTWDTDSSDDFAGISGTDDRLARFNAAGDNIEDSSILDLFNDVALTIDAVGRIGIGTSAPTALLSINTTTANAGRIRIAEGGDTTAGHYAGLDFLDNTTFAGGFYKNGATNNIGIWDATFERFTVEQGGNIGIGTTNPEYRLDVAGSANVSSLYLAGTQVTSTAAELNYLDGTTVSSGAVLFGNGTYITEDQANFFFDNSANRLGLGTTAPGQTLTINGTLGIGGSDPQYTTVFQGGAQTANVTYTLPVDDGSNNYVLTTDGSGVLSWQSADGVGAGTGDITAVIAGSGLTGGATDGDATLNIGAGNGITVNADDIAIKLATTGGVGVTASFSGLEVGSDGLGLISGCAEGEILGWDDTNSIWECRSIASSGGVTGTGSDNYIPRWNGADDLQSSLIYQTDGGNIGIGTTAPGSLFSLAGAQTIGAGYATLAAPTNGLLVQGNVGIGVTATNYKLAVAGTASISDLVLGGTQVTSTAAELNILDGATLDVNELNILDGALLDVNELNYLNGATATSGGLIFGNATNDGFIQDTSQIYWNNTANRLGIGTSAPESKLTVAGGATFGSGYTGIGISAPLNGLLVQGNVGIGNTNPAYKLDVNGDIRAASGSDFYVGTIGLNDNSTTSSGASLIGLFDNTYTNIAANTTVQGAIGELDAAITTLTNGYISAIGDVGSGDAFTSGGTQGTSLWFYDADGRGQLTIANLTAPRTYTLPDASGEISLLGQTIANNELVNSDITFNGDSGSAAVSLGGDFTLSGGTGISTAISGTTVTITNDDGGSAQNIFKNFAVSGQNTVVADGNNDTLSLVAGTNVTITTDDTTDSITITAADTDTTYTAGNGLNLDGTEFNFGGLIDEDTRLYSATSGELLFINDTTGNIGLGTTAPGSKLAVSGNQTIGSGYATFAAPTNGLIVQGNVGIGVTATNYKLSVAGTASFSNLVLGGTQITATGTEINLLSGLTSTTAELNYLDGTTVTDGGVLFANGSYITQDAANFFFDDSTNRLGIGTTAPTTVLDVAGTGRFTGQLSLLDVPSTTNNDQVLTVNGGVVSYIDTSGWDTDASDDFGGISGTDNRLARFNAAGDNIEDSSILDEYTGGVALSLFSNGNVGIGVTASAFRLGVGGTANVETLAIAGNVVTSSATELNILDGATLSTAELNILDGVTSTASEINLLDGTTVTDGGLTFGNGTYITQDAANLFWDDSTNRLGIGTTAPGTSLDVVGGIRTSDDFYVGNIGLGYTSSGSAGALLVGVFDEFANSSSTNVQDVLDDLDAAITGSTHDPVTLAGSYDYLTLSGQEITLGQIDLATDVSGLLSVTNGGLGANVTAAGAGEILYSSSTSAYDSLAAGSSNQILLSGGAGAPSWSNIASLLTAGDDIDITGTTNATVALEDAIDVTSVSASGAAGLSLLDDGSNLGVFIQDGGNVGIGSTAPNALLAVGNNNQFNVNSSGNITRIGGVAHSIANSTSDLVITSAGELIFDDSNVSSTIQLSDADTTLPNANIGIIDAINDAYNAAVGAGSGVWTLASNVIHPTTVTNDFAIGGSTLAASVFSIDESAGLFLFGGDQTANPTLRFEATDSDTGDFGFNTNDSFYFSGARVGVGTTGPGSLFSVAAGTSIGSTYALYAAPTNGLIVEGNTGIGVTATNYKLEVSGSTNLGSLFLSGTQVTADATELNTLDGVNATLTAGELNILDGALLDVNELNILNGATLSTAELNILDGVTSTTAEVNYLDNSTVTSGGLVFGNGTNFTQDVPNIFFNDSTNRLGIGTSAPAYTLDVNGSARIAAGSDLLIGTIGLGSTGTASSGASLVGLFDNSFANISSNTTVQSAIGQLDSAIGTRTFTGEFNITDGDSLADIAFDLDQAIGDRTAYSEENYVANNESLAASIEALDVALSDVASGASGIWTDLGTTTYLTTLTDNVGIGVTATNFKLAVAGTASFNNLVLGGTQVTSSAAELNILTGATLSTAELNILDGVTSTFSELNYLDGTTVTNGAVLFGNGTYITEDQANFFFDNSTNRLGLGTTAPTSRLHISQSSQAASQGINVSEGNNSISLYNGNGNNSYLDFSIGTANIRNTRSAGAMLLSTDRRMSFSSAANTDSGFRFITNSGNSLEITSSGLVGIGTTAPTALLSVGSTSHFQVNTSGNVDAIGGVAHTIANSSGNLAISSNADLVFDDSTLASAIQLTDADNALPNANIGIVDAINDAYNAAVGSAGGVWTLGSGVIYPTTVTNDFAIGGTSLASSVFSIDESAGLFLFGGDQTANPTLRFEATDSDTADFGFNTNDSFYFTGGNVGIGTTNPGAYRLGVSGTAAVSDLVLGGTLITSSAAELNILDGATLNATELNYLDGTTVVSGGITFGNGTYIAQDAANLFWDNSTDRLGLGTTAPVSTLSIGSSSQFQVNSSGNIVALGGVAHSVADVSGDLQLTSNADLIFEDSTLLSAIQLTDADNALPNGNIGIVDAINDAYDAAVSAGGVWTDGGDTTYLTSLTDNVGIGVTATNYKLSVAGTADLSDLSIGGTLLTSTAAELNILDGALLDVNELNILNGATLSTAELNILDGATTTFSELNYLDGTTVTAGGISFGNGTFITQDAANLFFNDSTNRLGLGTTAPGSTLSVAGNTAIGSGYAGLAGPTNGLIVEGNIGVGVTATNYKLSVAGTGNFSNLAVGGTLLSANSSATSGASLIGLYDNSLVNISADTTVQSAIEQLDAAIAGSSHAAVTLSGSYDYITLSGQDIIRGQIDLATDVSGLLAVANGGLGANVTAAGAGELLYSDSTTTYDSLAAGSSGQFLTSNGAAAPAWSNITSFLTAGNDIDITGTTNATITLEDDIDVSAVRASTSAGLGLYDDGSNLGIYIRDGGNVGVGGTAAGSRLSITGNQTIGAGYASTIAPTNGLLVEGNVGIGMAAPEYSLDVSGIVRSLSLLTESLVLSNANTGTLRAQTGFDGFVGFMGGIATGGKDSLSTTQRLTASGNLTNIGSIQAGETLFTSGGTFAADVTYTVGTEPWGTDIGDLDGDGYNDIVAANSGSDQVSVLINDGDGTFATKVDYTVAASPETVRIGDLNGDGYNDIVVEGSTLVSVLINDGDGTFATKVDYTSGFSTDGLVLADVDNDGDLDAITSHDSSAGVLINDGSGVFGTIVDYAVLASSPQNISAGDLNGDGYPDITVSYSLANNISVLMNDGDGTFATKVDYSTGGVSDIGEMEVVDVNGDNKADVLGALGNGYLKVYINNGDGTLAAGVDYASINQSRRMDVGDINGDGMPDAVMQGGTSDGISVLLNNGDGTFATQVHYAGGTDSLTPTLGDFNNDGKLDVVISNYTDNNVSVLMNAPTPMFYAQASTGRIGIGTTGPRSLLSVAGGATFGSGYAGLGISAPQNGLLIEGNVGIGNTNPAFKLDVNGDVRVASGSDFYVGAIGLNDNASTSSGASLIGLNDNSFTHIAANTNLQSAIGQLDSAITAATFTMSGTDNRIARFNAAGDNVEDSSISDLYTGGVVMTIDDAGSIGIGITPAVYKLNVAGSTNTSSLYISDVQVTSSAAELNILDGVTTDSGELNFLDGASANNGGIVFGNGTNYTQDTTNFFWNDTSNRLGIGTTGPAAALDVAGTAWLRGTGTSGLYVNSSGNVGIGGTAAGAPFFFNNSTGFATNLSSATALTIGASGTAYATFDTTLGASSDLFSLNLPASSSIENIFAIYDNGSPVFKVSQNQIESAVPHTFTAAGDVSMAYDLNFTNATSSYINFEAPGYIRTNHPSGNYNLTLSAANDGVVFLDDDLTISGDTLTLTSAATLDLAASTTALNIESGLLNLDTTNTRVGIGTTAPNAMLTVAGNILPSVNDTYNLGSDTFRFADAFLGGETLHIGTSTSDEYAIGYNTTNNTLGFNVNGSGNPEIVFDSNGRIGIGTTAPVSFLHVSDATSPALVLLDTTNTVSTVLQSLDTVGLTGTSSAHGFALLTDSTTRMFVNATGQVGLGTVLQNDLFEVAGGTTIGANYVGTGAAAPTNGLLVEGNVGIGTTGPQAKLDVSSTANGPQQIIQTSNQFAGLSLRSETDGGGQGAQNWMLVSGAGAASRHFALEDVTAGGTAFNSPFIAEAGSTANALWLDNTARVGIGTTGPQQKLHVSGGDIKLDNTRYFRFAAATGGDAGIRMNALDDMEFTDSTSGVNVFTIEDGGNVGVGVTGSTYKLDVRSSTTSGGFQLTADSVTTGTGANFSFDGLTTGTGLNLASTSTALTTGELMTLDWSPTGSTEIFATGDLFSINLGQYANIGNIFALYDNGNDLFKVSQSQIESAVPHAFTAAGDVSIANDLQFTNQTAANIKSNGPLTIESGESFENLDLTLKPSGSGSVIVDDGSDLELYTGESLIFDTDDGANTYFTHDSTNDRIQTYVDGTEMFRFDTGGNSSNGSVGITLADLAEKYPTLDETLEPGDVVVLDRPTEEGELAADVSKYLVARSDVETKDKVLGVVSSKPGLILGGGDFRTEYCALVEADEEGALLVSITKEIRMMAEAQIDEQVAAALKVGQDISADRETMLIELIADLTEQYESGEAVLDLGVMSAIEDSISACKSTKQVDVALAGRVPVKVDSSNGEIVAGDLLAVSDIEQGKVMKATENGWVVGRALEDYNEESGMVMMFVTLTWYDGAQESLAFDTNAPVDLDALKAGLEDILEIEDNGAGDRRAIFFSDMNVMGNVTADSFSTLGTISAGFLTIDGSNDSISVIGGGDLKLQDGVNPGNIDAFNGALVLTSDGGIIAQAEIAADTIVARKVAVLGEETVAEQAVSADGSTIGEGILGAGLLEVTITNANVKPESKIFITPTTGTGGRALIVKSKADGSFVVSIDSAHSTQIEFDYWVVEVR